MAGPESPSELPLKAYPIPNFPIEPDLPPRINVPNYTQFRQDLIDDARNFQHDNEALIAQGKIPGLDLSQQGKADSTATRTLHDGRKISLKFDAQSHLSEIEITSKNGDRDVASIRDGRVQKEIVKANGATVSYQFNDHNQIAHETIFQGDIRETHDFVDNQLVHGHRVQKGQGLVADLINQPDQHTYRIDQPDGNLLRFEYDENGKFEFGIDHQVPALENDRDETWLISPDAQGKLKIVRGEET